MKGLLLKDFYSLHSYWKIYALYMLIFGGVAVATGNTSFFGAMSGVLIFTLPFSSFTVDEQSHWDRMVLSMPVSRKQVVASKYILALFFVALAIVVQIIVVLLCTLTPRSTDIYEMGWSMISSVMVICIGLMIIYPFVFWLGADKGRIVMMIAFGAVFVLIMVAGVLSDVTTANIAPPPISFVAAGSIAILAVVGFISYLVSCKIYSRKSF